MVSPKELKQKRCRQKLSKIKDSARNMTTELNQATLLLSSAYKSLLNPKKGYKQTFPLPLALCNPSGQMRTCNKSSFKDVIQNIFQTENIFLSQCPLLQSNSSLPKHELIVDFLYLLHQPPPPPDSMTFSSYAKYLWEKITN